MELNNMTFEKYPQYKDSEVDWIGEIPEHWKIIKLKNIGNFSASGIDKTLKKNELKVKIVNFTDVYKNTSHILGNDIVYMVVTAPKNVVIKNIVKKGDLLFLPSSETYEDIGLCALADENLDNTSFSYHLLRYIFSRNVIHSFKKYFTNNFSVLNQFSKMATGTTRKILGRNSFKNIQVLLPPLPEQTRIANFLDSKCQLIDKAIAQKEQLIQLLKERKQIVIQNAVTKGLNPDVKMKDSGVEWIGEIPDHWEVKRCKYLFHEVDKRSKEGKEELLSVSHMTGVSLRSEKNVSMFLAENYAGSKLCRKGDLIFNIMWTWMGALGVSDQLGIVSPSYGVYRPKHKNLYNSKYLEELLKSTKYIEYYNKISTGLHSSRLRFYPYMFFNMKIGYPDIYEQNKIVNYIKIKSNKIDKLISNQLDQIQKLKEYKTTLIDSAVTGKIKI